jgi:hypothetical protein
MAPRLVQRGHEVTVFGRSNIIDYQGSNYKGVRIKVLPTIRHKYFDTVAHTCLCPCTVFLPPMMWFLSATAPMLCSVLFRVCWASRPCSMSMVWNGKGRNGTRRARRFTRYPSFWPLFCLPRLFQTPAMCSAIIAKSSKVLPIISPTAHRFNRYPLTRFCINSLSVRANMCAMSAAWNQRTTHIWWLRLLNVCSRKKNL